MATLDTTRLETFVLARLLVRPKSGFGLADLRRQLFPFVSHMLAESDWRTEVDAILERLRKAHFLAPNELRLSDEGRKEALSRLALDEVPPHANWPTFLAEVLVPAAVGVEPDKARLKSGDDLVALLLAREFELPVGDSPTLPQVLNALVWRALGLESTERLTGGALQRAILRRYLDGTRVKEPDRLARILAAKVSGARSVGSQPTRQAILREWLGGAHSKRPAANGSGESADTIRIESFAEAALNAARDPQTVRFGEHKAFIDSVFERYTSGATGPVMELPVFKNKLVAAHRKGLLTLARADLVEAMDPARVAASETRYMNSTFHFVEAD